MAIKDSATVKSSPEVRAFIYQQLSDLEEFLPQGSAVSVSILPEETKKLSFCAKIEIMTPGGTLLSTAIHGDEYAAIVSAKRDIKSQLEFWFHLGELEENDDSRERLIEAISEKRYLH